MDRVALRRLGRRDHAGDIEIGRAPRPLSATASSTRFTCSELASSSE
jgi:hypothetical protein